VPEGESAEKEYKNATRGNSRQNTEKANDARKEKCQNVAADN
jgi:hypothetical protein